MNRRFVGNTSPLVTELNDLVFTLEQYQLMRARVCVGGDTLVEAKKNVKGACLAGAKRHPV